MTLETRNRAYVHVAPLDELQAAGVKVVSAEGRTIAVFYSDGRPYAVDNRCPTWASRSAAAPCTMGS
jgi:nitrite reductase/ring-hydroxylating ferredoxin subunit